MDPDTAIRLTSSSFSSTTPFTPEACSWVTGEIATALGMSHSPDAGRSGGTPPGFDPIGQQGMPTQIAPIPGAGYPPGQAPTHGFGAVPGQGGPSGFGAGGQATTPGPWQAGGQPAGGQPGGAGFGGQPGAGYQGQPGGGFGGQPAGGAWQAGQPGFGQAPPPAGYAGQPGGAGWQPGGGGFGPTGPILPGTPGGPVRPRGSKRGLFVGGGIVLAIIVVVVVAVSLSGGKSGGGGGGGGGHNSSPAVTPSSPQTSPSSSVPVASGPEALTTIMNPAGLKPVGTQCVAAKTFGLNKATLTNSTFCAHTQRPNIVVWGYQFDNASDYQTGYAHINHFVGFDKVTPGSGCPPPSGSAEGKIGWHANNNPKYVSRTGQDIECLIDGNKPVLIWSMPTQNVFFIGQDNTTGTSINTILDWWKILNYG
jgi:hypothetical protein